MSDQADTTIAIEVTDETVANQIRAVADADVARGKAFDGSPDAITLLITLAPAILTPLASILNSALERRKHVRVVYKGTEIQGVSEKTLRKLLEGLPSSRAKRG